MLSLGLPLSQSTASVGPAGARRDRWLVPAGPSVAVDLAARAHWHGDRVLCSATGGGTSMRTAYPAGCLLTAEVASVPSGSQDPGRFTQQRWPQRVSPRTQGVSRSRGGLSVEWLPGPRAFHCVLAAARAPAITSASTAGRRREEPCCSGVPFYQKTSSSPGSSSQT